MKAKASSRQDRSKDRKGRELSGGKARRKPVFALSREQVFRKCRTKKHRLICAGEVSQTDLDNAVLNMLSQSSNKSNGVGSIAMNADVNYDQNQLQAVINKLEELINALRR